MAILTWADMIWGKPFYFVHRNFICSVCPSWQILIWVLVLVLDMKVLDVLKYFLKKWVLDQYLYLVYIWCTWCTWVLGQLYLTPTLVDGGWCGCGASHGDHAHAVCSLLIIVWSCFYTFLLLIYRVQCRYRHRVSMPTRWRTWWATLCTRSRTQTFMTNYSICNMCYCEIRFYSRILPCAGKTL